MNRWMGEQLPGSSKGRVNNCAPLVVNKCANRYGEQIRIAPPHIAGQRRRRLPGAHAAADAGAAARRRL